MISGAFLEHYLATRVASADPASEGVIRSLGRWRRCAERLGPSSSPRAIVETAAEPLMQILGFERCAGSTVVDDRIVAVLTADQAKAWKRLQKDWKDDLMVPKT